MALSWTNPSFDGGVDSYWVVGQGDGGVVAARLSLLLHLTGLLVLVFHQLVHSTFACSLEYFTCSVLIILLKIFLYLRLLLHLTNVHSVTT